MPGSNAFVPTHHHSQTYAPTTSLFGVRSALRRGLNKIQKPFRRSTSSSPTTAPRSPDYHHHHQQNYHHEHHESTPEWYKENNRVAVLTQDKQEHYRQSHNHALEQDRHREALVAAFHRHSPSMFDEHYHQQHQHNGSTTKTTNLSHSSSRTVLAHHPSENISEEENTAFSSASKAFSTKSNNNNKSNSKPSLVQRRRLNFQSDDPLYVLPHRTKGSMNRLEEEFHDMLSHFSNYSMRDLYALRDPRMRTLVHGVAASGDDVAVYRAFEILFEDLMPLRVAGRLVFQRLKSMMDKCIQEREEQITHVVDVTGLDARDVEEARIVFFEVASKLNHDVYLTPEQLTATRMFHSIHDRLNLESPSALVQKLDRHGNRKIGLEDFLIGLHQCAEDQCELEQNECYALEVVHYLLEEIDSMENPMELETKTAKLAAREAKELKHVLRYNEMVEIFKGWKDQVPWLWDKENPGRKWEVVQGCFVGAENEKVVDALRIVYVDYAPLRVAAEFIISLAASLLNLKPEVKR